MIKCKIFVVFSFLENNLLQYSGFIYFIPLIKYYYSVYFMRLAKFFYGIFYGIFVINIYKSLFYESFGASHRTNYSFNTIQHSLNYHF